MNKEQNSITSICKSASEPYNIEQTFSASHQTKKRAVRQKPSVRVGSTRLSLSNIPADCESAPNNNKFLQRTVKKIRNPASEFKAQLVAQHPVRRKPVTDQRFCHKIAAIFPLLKKNLSLNLPYGGYLQGKQASCNFPVVCEKTSQPRILPVQLPQTYCSTHQSRNRSDFSLVLPIASSTQLIPRIRESSSSFKSSGGSSNKLSDSPSNEVIQPDGDLNIEAKSDSCNDQSRKAQTFLSNPPPQSPHVFSLKQNFTFRDLSPVISCGGKIGFTIPARLSTPTIVNLSVEARPTNQKKDWNFSPALNWSQRMGLNTAPCLSFHTSSVSGSNSSPSHFKSSLDSSSLDILGLPSSSFGSDQDKLSMSYLNPTSRLHRESTKSGIPEHHSFVALPSSLNVPIANLGYMKVPGSTKGIRLRNSKSFHGDGTEGIGSHGGSTSQQGNLAMGSTVALRQQQLHRKMHEKQRMKMLKPLSVMKSGSLSKMNDGNHTEFAASMLPDPNSSFRMTNDVSFDEGSRYHGGGNPSMEIRKSADTSQRLKHSATNPTDCSPYSGHGRLDKAADSPSRDRHNHVTSSGYKETMPMSLVRIEERLNFDSALGRHPPNYPGSRGHSAQGRNHSASSCVLATPPAPTLTTFRLHKGRQNWNYKMGDLSVNGGGYYGSSPLQPGARIESSGLGSLSINSASNLSPKLGSQARERNGITIKSRMSSRYGCRMDSIGHSYNSSSAIRECQYSDPCQSAPASFQQRLMELSVLESETIKYERNRKLKRKKNQDKDS